MQKARSTLSKLEHYSAWIMLINGALGLIVSVGTAVLHRSAAGLIDSPPYISILGALAGLLSIRGAMAGLFGGLLFYAPQILSYYSKDLQLNFKSGISYPAVVELPHGVLVVNMAALTGLLVIVLILVRR
jgi:hypothetical protein